MEEIPKSREWQSEKQLKGNIVSVEESMGARVKISVDIKSKISLPRPMPRGLPPIFSSRDLMASGLISVSC